MIKKKLADSPLVYYINKCESNKWVLFIHAAFVDHNMFKKQIEYFKDKYNILAVDIIGHGDSIDTGRGDSMDKMSPWINEILKNENIEKIHLVGISLGSVIAQDFANRYPAKVQSLACFGGYNINDFDSSMMKENNASQMGMMFKAFVSIKLFAKENKKISAYTKAAQEEFYDMNLKFPKRSFMYMSTLNSMVNVYKTKKRTYPLMIGCGEKDIPAEIKAVEMWAQQEPECEVKIFKNAGHCVNMDVPDEFNSVIELFWSGNDE